MDKEQTLEVLLLSVNINKVEDRTISHSLLVQRREQMLN